MISRHYNSSLYSDSFISKSSIMSSTLLSTHASSLSLSTLSKPFASPLAPSSVTLPLPSRVPKNSNPAVAISPSDHIFVYNSESSFIWEYNSKGRRISEIALGKGEKAGKVACWEDGIVLSVRKQVRIMMKDYEGKIGKWRCSKVLGVSCHAQLRRYVS